MQKNNFKKISNYSRNLINIFRQPKRYKQLLETAYNLYQKIDRSKSSASNEKKIFSELYDKFDIQRGDMEWILAEIKKINNGESIDDIIAKEHNKTEKTEDTNIAEEKVEEKEDAVKISGDNILEILRTLSRLPLQWENSKVNKKRLINAYQKNLRSLQYHLTRLIGNLDEHQGKRIILSGKKKAMYDDDLEFSYDNIKIYANKLYNILFVDGLDSENVNSIRKIMKEFKFYLNQMKNDIELGYDEKNQKDGLSINKANPTVGGIKKQLIDIDKLLKTDENEGVNKLFKLMDVLGLDGDELKRQLKRKHITVPKSIQQFL